MATKSKKPSSPLPELGLTGRRRLSIEHYRKKLGEEYAHMTDEEIGKLRDFLYLLAEIEYEHYQSQQQKNRSSLLWAD